MFDNIINWFKSVFMSDSNVQSTTPIIKETSSVSLISLDQLTRIFPNTKSGILYNFIGPLNNTFIKYGINTPKRISYFLGQVGEESEFFQVMEENLNYSAKGLRSTFPTHFLPGEEYNYANQPQKIANRVYANRYGNGDEASGDGWKFRGRGCIQLTFKDNYEAYGKYLNKSVNDVINYLENYSGAVDVAGWFWYKYSLNAFADNGDIESITRHINGGTYGLALRKQITNDALKVLNGSSQG
jgi:putative chitinase